MHAQQIEQVYETTSRQGLRRRAIVLDAAGVVYTIREHGGVLSLIVPVSDADRARQEIEAYDHENDEPPVRRIIRPSHRSGAWIGVCVYVLVLLVMAGLTHSGAWGLDWRDAGRTQAGLIRDGQVWRTVTALTLHADAAHLIGNIVFGCLFGWFAGQLLGPGVAWLCIVAAGGAGNLLNAHLRPDAHSSLGASTAVFAALGIVAAYAWSARRHLQTSAFVRWGPIIVAIVLLGYLGAGGERTDVAAHVTGLVSGAILGALFERYGARLNVSVRGQFVLGLAALALVGTAWSVALGGA